MPGAGSNLPLVFLRGNNERQKIRTGYDPDCSMPVCGGYTCGWIWNRDKDTIISRLVNS